MRGSKGIAAGFVAGIVVAGGAVLLLRDGGSTRAPDDVRVSELGAQVGRLEQSVNRLSTLVEARAPRAPAHDARPPDVPSSAAQAKQPQENEQAHARALAASTGMVEQALQSGQWTRTQSNEFMMASASLSAEERADLMARISAAVNRNEVIPELH